MYLLLRWRQFIIKYIQQSMKACTNCSEYHNSSSFHAHKCFTYQKYTYLLKDQFLKWNKSQSKQSKNIQKSKNTEMYIEQSSVHEKKVQLKNIYDQQQPHNNSRIREYPLNNFGVVNKRINTALNKAKRCKEHNKACNHLKSTQPQQTFLSSAQQINNNQQFQKQTQSFEEHETAITLSVTPCQKPFEKPFNSRLLLNPVVYDSLKDNRICGIQFCDQGQIEGTNEKMAQILSKWKIS